MLSQNKRSRCLRAGLLAWGLAFLAGTVSAAVLVDQPFSNGGESFLSYRSGGLENADSFSLVGTSTVSAVAWWGTYNSSDSLDQFSVQLAQSLSGLSTATAELAGTVSVDSGNPVGTDSNGSSIYRFELALDSTLALSAGNYSLSVANEFAVDDPEFVWGWTAGSGGDGTSLYLDGNDWVEGASDLSFQIIGERQQQTVPEPGMLGLLGLGGVGLMFASRRRSRTGA